MDPVPGARQHQGSAITGQLIRGGKSQSFVFAMDPINVMEFHRVHKHELDRAVVGVVQGFFHSWLTIHAQAPLGSDFCSASRMA